MSAFWSKYRSEILAAIIGALLSGVLSLAVGLYSITKSFEYLRDKELLQQLRADITLLRSVENELDFNLKWLLSEQVSVNIETQRIGSWRNVWGAQADTETQKPLPDTLVRLLDAMIGGDVYEVTKAAVPRRKFRVEAWASGGAGVSEIDFSLIQEINDLYRDLRRLNEFIDKVQNISVGMAVRSHFAEQLPLDAATYDSLAARISGDSILSAKNSVSEEIQRLNDRRRRLGD